MEITTTIKNIFEASKSAGLEEFIFVALMSDDSIYTGKSINPMKRVSAYEIATNTDVAKFFMIPTKDDSDYEGSLDCVKKEVAELPVEEQFKELVIAAIEDAKEEGISDFLIDDSDTDVNINFYTVKRMLECLASLIDMEYDNSLSLERNFANIANGIKKQQDNMAEVSKYINKAFHLTRATVKKHRRD